MLEAAAAEISAATGGQVLPVQLDIRDPVAVEQAVNKIEEELGLPNVVVHNAAGQVLHCDSGFPLVPIIGTSFQIRHFLKNRSELFRF